MPSVACAAAYLRGDSRTGGRRTSGSYPKSRVAAMRKKTAKTNECIGQCIRDERWETGRGGGEVHIPRCAPPRSLREAEAGMAVTVKERGVGARTKSEGSCHETGKRKASRACPARKTTSISRYRYYNTDQGRRFMNRIDHQSFCREIDLLITSPILHAKQKYCSYVLTPPL
jgi:hypothetical protein